jgi:hypothetical protein
MHVESHLIDYGNIAQCNDVGGDDIMETNTQVAVLQDESPTA